MQNTDPIFLKSHLNGLWFRGITKAIAILLGIGYGCGIILRPLLSYSGKNLLFNLITLTLPLALALGIAAIPILRNSPMKWKNHAKVDIQNKLITISKNGNSSNNDAIDSNGVVIPFSEVDFIQSEVYESFLASAYYLLSVSANGKQYNMVSMNDAYAYSQLLNRLEHELGFNVQVS